MYYEKPNMQGCGIMPPDVTRIAEPVERVSEVWQALNRLTDAVQRYDYVVGALGPKLGSVLLPSSPTVAGNEKEVGYQTDLANHINAIRCRIGDITDNLESMVSRIEL